MPFSLRPATADDFPVVRTMIHAARINPLGLDWRRFVVAIAAEGEIIGCGQIKPHGDGSLELASIVVVPAWRGRGVARTIIEYLLMNHTSGNGAAGDVPDLYLTCRSSLGPFYARFGFRAIEGDEMPSYFRRLSRLAGLLEGLQKEGETLLVMKRAALLPTTEQLLAE